MMTKDHQDKKTTVVMLITTTTTAQNPNSSMTKLLNDTITTAMNERTNGAINQQAPNQTNQKRKSSNNRCGGGSLVKRITSSNNKKSTQIIPLINQRKNSKTNNNNLNNNNNNHSHHHHNPVKKVRKCRNSQNRQNSTGQQRSSFPIKQQQPQRKPSMLRAEFRAKGKPPPQIGSRRFEQTPSSLTPNQMTTIYRIPNEDFQTTTDVARYNDYEILSELTKGGFSIIYKAKNLKTGKFAALKVVNLKDGDDLSERIIEMKNELFIMEMVKNLFVIELYLHYMVNHELYIFMKYAEFGTLTRILETEGVFSERKAKYFFAQMCASVEHLHVLSIAHRDIKPSNFLLSEKFNKKILMISDFGLSTLIKKNKKGKVEMNETQCGTPPYMPPELLSGDFYNSFLADVWSLGVTLYAMLNLQTPFDTNQPDYGVRDMQEHRWKFSSALKSSPSLALKKILSNMLEPKLEKRFDLAKTIEHEWLADEYQKIKHFERSMMNEKKSETIKYKNK